RRLVGERWASSLTTPVEATQVPATVQAVLAARIDRLPAVVKQLLQSAAVIGKDVAVSLLEAVAGQPVDDVRRGLTQLQTAEFLYETSLFPELEYTFKHALTQEVAYSTLLLERRRELHARIVTTIETLHADRLANEVDQLAHHAYRGALWGQAVAYFRQAGSKAAMSSAYRESVACFRTDLPALDRQYDSRTARGVYSSMQLYVLRTL